VKRKKTRSTRGAARRARGTAKGSIKRARTRRVSKARGKKAAPRKAGKKAATRKSARKPRQAARASASRRSSPLPRARLDLGWKRGLGPEAAGQSGDIEGIPREELADSESVEELLEEGQAFEAGIVEGVENAPDADEGEVRTREVPEDDVPQEYLDKD
jgi:hypothetical protein